MIKFFGAFFDRRQDQTSLPSVDYFFLNANYIYYLQGKRLVRMTEIQIQKQIGIGCERKKCRLS